jgi:short-subunit dehydrogenase
MVQRGAGAIVNTSSISALQAGAVFFSSFIQKVLEK